MPTRTPLVAGNWKMNTDRAGAIALARAVVEGSEKHTPRVEVALYPPFVYLDAVGATLRESIPATKVTLGAQDVYHEKNGAFTGEISAAMLRDIGATSVLTGHSERRHVLHESDELIAKKTRAALDAGGGLRCILCIGETLDQRQAGQTDAVNERQLRSALTGLPTPLLAQLVIAYEPVWAIGTGKTATPADAQAAHHFIRALLNDLFGSSVAAATRILYGGSVKPDNARDLFSQPDIDGGLIGGASLNPADFVAIVAAADR
ncbi:MAG TPA: triose-phosphate isomerase [Phycisphaerales bacterium]|nr:triose-phosphate isomerase [Phycisphaerales bacterium]